MSRPTAIGFDDSPDDEDDDLLDVEVEVAVDDGSTASSSHSSKV